MGIPKELVDEQRAAGKALLMNAAAGGWLAIGIVFLVMAITYKTAHALTSTLVCCGVANVLALSASSVKKSYYLYQGITHSGKDRKDMQPDAPME